MVSCIKTKKLARMLAAQIMVPGGDFIGYEKILSDYM